MDLGLAMLICLVIFIVVGFVIFQARFAAQHWRRVIAEGDQGALTELLDATFETWRNGRPPKGMPPADWRAMHTAAIVAADKDRARVSLLAEPDVRVMDGQRVEVGNEQDVARRAAVRMAERLLWEVPHVSFQRVQVDVLAEFRRPDGGTDTACLLTTRVDRETASWSDWDEGAAEEILGEWDTRERLGETYADPDRDAIIAPEEIEAGLAVREAEAALRPRDGEDRHGYMNEDRA